MFFWACLWHSGSKKLKYCCTFVGLYWLLYASIILQNKQQKLHFASFRPFFNPLFVFEVTFCDQCVRADHRVEALEAHQNRSDSNFSANTQLPSLSWIFVENNSWSGFLVESFSDFDHENNVRAKTPLSELFQSEKSMIQSINRFPTEVFLNINVDNIFTYRKWYFTGTNH